MSTSDNTLAQPSPWTQPDDWMPIAQVRILANQVLSDAAIGAAEHAWADDLTPDVKTRLATAIRSAIARSVQMLTKKYPSTENLDTIVHVLEVIHESGWEPPETDLWLVPPPIDVRLAYRVCAAIIASFVRSAVEPLHRELDNQRRMIAFNRGMRSAILDALITENYVGWRFVLLATLAFKRRLNNWPIVAGN